LWAFLAWLGKQGWREWLLISSFVVVVGSVVMLIGAAGDHVISYLIAVLR